MSGESRTAAGKALGVSTGAFPVGWYDRRKMRGQSTRESDHHDRDIDTAFRRALWAQVLIFALLIGLATSACGSPNRMGGAPTAAEPAAQISSPSSSDNVALASAGESSAATPPDDPAGSGQPPSQRAEASEPGTQPLPGPAQGPIPVSRTVSPAGLGPAVQGKDLAVQGKSSEPARSEQPALPGDTPNPGQPTPVPDKTENPVTRIGGAPEGVTESDQLGGATFEKYRESQEALCSEEIGRADCVQLVEIPADAPATFFACSADPAPAFQKKIPVGTIIKVTVKLSCFNDSVNAGS